MSAKHLRRTCVALMGILQLVQCAYLRLYSDDITLRQYTEVALCKSTTLLHNVYYKANRKNFFYIFGFTRNPDAESSVTVLREVVALKQYNVFLLNWEKEASVLSSITPSSLKPMIKQISLVVSAIPQAFHIGTKFGEELIRMSKAGFNLSETYIAGHSLGAQIAGQAGRTALGAGEAIERIYGLDPSGHMIYGEKLPSLNAGDAKFVFCVHTDPGGYGINKTLCRVDVLVNFNAFTQPDETKQVQPGCPIGNFQKYTVNDTCSHNRSWMLFAEGLRHPESLVASKEPPPARERCPQDYPDTVAISIDWDQTKSGVYFLATNPTPPYGKGVSGPCL